MYSSLDQIDGLAEQGEVKRCLQTDHRDAIEIEQEGVALSTLFAAIRVINPRRFFEADDKVVVVYNCSGQPPESMQNAIWAAGAELTIKRVPTPAPHPRPDLLPILNRSFAELADSVVKEYGVEFTLEGLFNIQQQLAEVVVPPIEEEEDDSDEEPEGEMFDEIAYWTAVLKLGAFSGELIRQSADGEWITSDQGTIPISLRALDANGKQWILNPLGKAVKFFVDPAGDSIAHFTEAFIMQLQSPN